MKGYYLFAPVEKGLTGPSAGVERKVRAQHKVLNIYSDCELVILPEVEYQGSIPEKVIRRLPYFAAWRKWKYHGEFNHADYLYIRQVYHDFSFVHYLRAIRKWNSDVKIIYEIPTYPYDQQNKGYRRWSPLYLKEKLNRKKVAREVDRIVTFYGQENIWGVPCIRLMNGFDFSSTTLANRTASDEIHMVSVAQTAFWHGYQYMIEGLRDYYANGGSESIIFHMVGYVLPQHKELVRKYHLESHVIFHGRLSGDELGRVYQQSQLGINVLGVSSDGNPKSSSLKSREYGAFGLPIVSSLPIDYLPDNYPYLHLVPDVNEPVDVNGVISFFHQVYDGKDCNQIAKTIREYAKEHCDMQVTMKPVIDWLVQQ